ncbi:hypothetical protein D6825_01820 [Candidatus Woesearchaeota archaeon]|nr:MAG: hypothetical protein D6825_01820 [Candidatus Woesearchaeota archaeon]
MRYYNNSENKNIVEKKRFETVQNHRFSHLSKIAFFLLLLAGLTLFSQASIAARTGNYATIQSIIARDFTVFESVNLTLSNSSAKEIFWPVPYDVERAKIDGRDAEVLNGSMVVPLGCSSCNIAFSYSYRLERDDEEFERAISSDVDLDELTYFVALPQGYYLISDKKSPSIVPVPYKIQTNGRQIGVEWKLSSPRLPQLFLVRFEKEESKESLATELADEVREGIVWFLMLMSLLTGAIAGFVLHKYYLKRFRETDLPFIPKSLLTPDELKVIGELRRSKGPVNQKAVCKSLDWSKSKVSAIMSSLAHKGIVEREKIGRNYRIVLKKEVES